MQLSNQLKFLIKTWLTTIFVAPIIWLLFFLFYNQFFDVYFPNLHLLYLCLSFIPLGILFSLPCFFLAALLVGLINRKPSSSNSKKITLLIISLSLTLALFIPFLPKSIQEISDDEFTLGLFVTYILVIVFSIYFYRLNPDV